MSSLGFVQIPVVHVSDRAEAARLLRLSAEDVCLLWERGIFETTPPPTHDRVPDEVLDTPLVRQWTVAAVLVEKDSVFAGLVDPAQHDTRSGGLLRYHRASRRVTLYSVPDPIHSLARAGGHLFLGTTRGAYLLKDGAFTRIVYTPDR